MRCHFFPRIISSDITCDVFLWTLTITSSLTIVISRRDRQSFLKSRKDPSERLRKLDKVSPTCTLEKWWATTKGNLGLSEAVDGQFVWYVFILVY